MADSIVVAGIGVALTSFQERPRTQRGEAVRAFDLTLLDGTDGGKRTWEGTTDVMLPAGEAALRAAIGSGSVVCSGLVLYGESVLCKVTVEGASRGPDVLTSPRPDWTAVASTLSLVLVEV